jgi:hypothetical protein
MAILAILLIKWVGYSFSSFMVSYYLVITQFVQVQEFGIAKWTINFGEQQDLHYFAVRFIE